MGITLVMWHLDMILNSMWAGLGDLWPDDMASLGSFMMRDSPPVGNLGQVKIAKRLSNRTCLSGYIGVPDRDPGLGKCGLGGLEHNPGGAGKAR